MFYRDAGQYKTTYQSDMAIFPLRQDRIGILVILALAYVAVPLMASDFILKTIMLPFLALVLAVVGLNILTGYTGLISLGTAGFMGVGAYACYKLTTLFPEVNILVWILVSGFFSAAIGVVFGLPSLRIKGLYLAVATLAAQFFLQWAFVRIPWLYNYNPSGAIEVPLRTVFGVPVTGPTAAIEVKYLIALTFVVVLTWVASNIVHGRIGRSWMAVRDMDIAAQLMGIKLLETKLLAFAVSSFYCGVSGALFVFIYLGGAEAGTEFGIRLSFIILFAVIIGGLGSMIGSFFGAGFIVALPTILKFGLPAIGIAITGAIAEKIVVMVIGALTIFLLIVEPHGLARLWQIAKQKLRVWPFPY
ncbi:branched-chain amino acid ABC transporter permease [Phreatobacter sp.]|uniref:branched-chain amino acid ABC transporter permease n=1 Tax=Phreatobacter sp. TaxID=1966341 RepID=UPI0022CA249D|nr:branched-chain amino acid ABC transporter permease [Phreatobacter sp.]MCZ8316238.1 branched-chain amino acid ABC transporter permease [Phreatobacter sp.]